MRSNHLFLCPFPFSFVAAQPNSHIRAARSHLTSQLMDGAPMSALHHCVRPHLVWPTGGPLVSDTSSPRSPWSHGSRAHVSHDQPGARGRLLCPVGNLIIRADPLTLAYKYRAPVAHPPSTVDAQGEGGVGSKEGILPPPLIHMCANIEFLGPGREASPRLREVARRLRGRGESPSHWWFLTRITTPPRGRLTPWAARSRSSPSVRHTLFCSPCPSLHVAPVRFGFGALGESVHDTPARPPCAGGRRCRLGIVSGGRITGNVDHWAYNFD